MIPWILAGSQIGQLVGISRGARWYQIGVFGPPLDLAQAVRQVNTRDFIVLDVPEK